MPQISNTNLQHIIDKLARFAAEAIGDTEFNPSFNAGMQVASSDVISGSNSIATFLLTLSDEDVLSDLLPPSRVIDESNPALPSGVLMTLSGVAGMVRALDTHFKNFTYKGLDDYLTSINGLNGMTPTLRAHGHFKKYFQTLSSRNSFIPNDLVIATFTETGASTGTYAHVASIDQTKYAGAKFVVKNVTALTTSAVVSVTAKKADGTTATLTATLSTHTINHETDLSDTSQIYVDVTGISITTGTNADEFEIVAKTDRSVASA